VNRTPHTAKNCPACSCAPWGTPRSATRRVPGRRVDTARGRPPPRGVPQEGEAGLTPPPGSARSRGMRQGSRRGGSLSSRPAPVADPASRILRYLPAAIVKWRWPRCPWIARARSSAGEKGARPWRTSSCNREEDLVSPTARRPARAAAPALLRIGWVGLTIIGLFFAVASLNDLRATHASGLPADHATAFTNQAGTSYAAVKQAAPGLPATSPTWSTATRSTSWSSRSCSWRWSSSPSAGLSAGRGPPAGRW
jgi:hypothetical protein